MLDVTSKREFKHTEEIVQWRSINQEQVENLWEEVCAKMDEEVMEKYRVEESKKSAYKGTW